MLVNTAEQFFPAWESEPPPQDTVTVIGAGIIGLAVGLNLRRRGLRVMVLDPLPGGGASFGNGGLFSVDTMTPLAFPGMARSVPGWLMDPTGPLRIDPMYLPQALPWLLGLLRESMPERVAASAAALRALHRDSFDRYRELLGAEIFSRHIHESGSVQVWDSDAVGPSEALGRRLREAHGIQVEALGPAELRELFPGINDKVKRGEFFRRQGYTASPQRLMQALAELFVDAGGVILRQKVLKIVPREGGHYLVFTNVANLYASRVVVAAGAWSREVLASAGFRLPMDTERGYHVVLERPSITLKYPLLHRGRGFGMTPMEEGLRIAGTVEIAGLAAPPDERRTLALRRNAEALFPGLSGTIKRLWLGFRPTLPDSVPAIGLVPGHHGLYVATGHNHYGMLSGAASGRLLAELMTGATPHIDPAPYSPSRFK